MLPVLRYGMPIGCNPSCGVGRVQKNHFSALAYKTEVGEYFDKGVQSQQLLGPFEKSPLDKLCFSPLMSVPKEDCKRRVVVDFSFPPDKSINDGISASEYLDFTVEFSLPSVGSMVSRLNELGAGCLMFKRDLKGAFRQFWIDPGDYSFTGLSWNGKVYIDTRLAMGLRSSVYCCQSITEMIAKVAGERGFILIYLVDFGGAEQASKAVDSFTHLGSLLEYFGLEEAPEKAVAPTTKMD